MGRAELKVPGGKLLRADSTVMDGKLRDVKITGDFFMHPEDSINELESRLRGVEASEEGVSRAVIVFFERSSTRILGASPQDFVEVILRSLSTQ